MQPNDPFAFQSSERLESGLRHVTIFFSDIAGFSGLTQRVGDMEASRVTNQLLTLQQIVITREGLGEVVQFGGDSVFAVFEHASVALSRALEIQRLMELFTPTNRNCGRPKLRIGLHMGEVLLRKGERIELVSRHVNRAHRVMEAAAPGQILASEVVVDAARDFIDIPRDHLAIRYFGEYYLKGVGATGICEIADARLAKEHPSPATGPGELESALISKLELAGYRVVSRLGEGAYGVVYRAESEKGGRAAAVKVLNPALCDSSSARERFAREVQLVGQLNTPGIAVVLEQRLVHQPPFLVMELVDGESLDTGLNGASAEQIGQVFLKICETLEPAHAAGIIHGDLKPGNILLRNDKSPVLLDFGLSTFLSSTENPALKPKTLPVAPGYLAPETIQGMPPTPAMDVYALGVILYRILAGREPFAQDTIHQLVQAHLHEDPELPAVFNPKVADGLQRICLKALEKKPEERYSSAREMGMDLARFCRGEVIRTRPTAYDNLLFHRVARHVEQIKLWNSKGLLGEEESHRLLSSYEVLQRRGLPAVMEGRTIRLWQTLVYVGGWAVINGALLWLMQHYDELTRPHRLLLGSVPALTTFGLAIAMWQFERFRLFFVSLIVAVVATPLLTGVWLHEFEIGGIVPAERLELEVLHQTADSHWLTNDQLLWTTLVTLAVASAVMVITRTTTHSAQTLMALVFCYGAVLLPLELRPHVERGDWAMLGLQCVPLCIMLGLIAAVLLQKPERIYQAPPWIYGAAILLPCVLCAVSIHGLTEWWPSLSSILAKPMSFLLLSASGLVQTGLGLAARRYLRHRGRLATLIPICTGLLSLLVGLALAGWKDTWPSTWPATIVLGRVVPLPHLTLPVAAFLITVAACRFQLLAFLMVGLAGLAFSIHVLGNLYFDQVSAWPKTLMSLGAACFFAALYHELRRTRGNTIDDVIRQSRL